MSDAKSARHAAVYAPFGIEPGSESAVNPNLRPGRAHHGAIIVVAIVLVALLIVALFIAVRGMDADDGTLDRAETGFDANDAFENEFRATPAAMDAIPQTTGLETFSLTGHTSRDADEIATLATKDVSNPASGSNAVSTSSIASSSTAPKLGMAQSNAIENAVAAIEEYGQVGVVLINLKNGNGIAYNPDAAIYGASSFKAPYALYICETFVENGAFSIPGISATGDSDFYGEGSFVKDLIEDAVVNSDNDAFATLRGMYDFQGFDEWVTALGAYDAAYTEESWFPWYSARSSAKLWAEMLEYWRGGSDAALWLQSLCAETNQSFLRDATEPLGAVVLNKAGWCSGYDYGLDFNAICDAGVVQIDDEFYLVSVMTGAPDDEDNRQLVENLIEALFAARDSL